MNALYEMKNLAFPDSLIWHVKGISSIQPGPKMHSFLHQKKKHAYIQASWKVTTWDLLLVKNIPAK